jgi:hypothetical protein
MLNFAFENEELVEESFVDKAVFEGLIIALESCYFNIFYLFQPFKRCCDPGGLLLFIVSYGMNLPLSKRAASRKER